MTDVVVVPLPFIDVRVQANSGIGRECVKVLAAADMHVILACRNSEAAAETAASILQSNPKASLECQVKLSLCTAISFAQSEADMFG